MTDTLSGNGVCAAKLSKVHFMPLAVTSGNFVGRPRP